MEGKKISTKEVVDGPSEFAKKLQGNDSLSEETKIPDFLSAKETLEYYFKVLQKKDVKYTDVYLFLTKTHQNELQYIGRIAMEGHISGIHSIVKECSKIGVREKKISKTCADMVVTFHGKTKVKFSCRLIKEIGVGKPSEEGVWGINVNSFKLLKP